MISKNTGSPVRVKSYSDMPRRLSCGYRLILRPVETVQLVTSLAIVDVVDRMHDTISAVNQDRVPCRTYVMATLGLHEAELQKSSRICQL